MNDRKNDRDRNIDRKGDRTLDLFAAPTGAPGTENHDGDGRRDPAGPESAPDAVALPALGDTELSAPAPFRVPGLKSLVLPIPVFRLQLVRERDHLTRQVHSPSDAARVCAEMLEGFDREVFLVLALSAANRLIGANVAHIGTVDASIASPREVFKFALLSNARSIIVSHNHPSGNLEPSAADVSVSKGLKAAGDVLNIQLLDSLVVGYDGAYTSLAERGLI